MPRFAGMTVPAQVTGVSSGYLPLQQDSLLWSQAGLLGVPAPPLPGRKGKSPDGGHFLALQEHEFL